MMTDPVADLLTRIRTASRARKEWAEIPWSGLKQEIVRVLCEEGYAREYSVADAGVRKTLKVALKYDAYRRPAITALRRVSRPSLRVYVPAKGIPAIRRGLGVSILSTPRGVVADRVARKENVGGEILCAVW